MQNPSRHQTPCKGMNLCKRACRLLITQAKLQCIANVRNIVDVLIQAPYRDKIKRVQGASIARVRTKNCLHLVLHSRTNTLRSMDTSRDNREYRGNIRCITYLQFPNTGTEHQRHQVHDHMRVAAHDVVRLAAHVHKVLRKKPCDTTVNGQTQDRKYGMDGTCVSSRGIDR